MGMIYRRKRKLPDGTVIEGEIWWIKYYANGRAHRESTESTKKDDAKTLLRQREVMWRTGCPTCLACHACASKSWPTT